MKKNKIKLFPYQKEGLERTLKNPFYPLFMEAGTGKTPIVIKSIEQRYKDDEIQRVLLFVPNTILYNWELEIAKFLNIPKSQYIVERLNIKKKDKRLEAYYEFIKNDLSLNTLKELKAKGYEGTKKKILSDHKPKLLILLLNYEKAPIMYKDLRKFKAQMLVIDESHKLKNRGAQISKNIYKLGRDADYRILLTGTPICNGYEDLFMQYKILDPDIFGPSYGDFENKYIIKGGYMGYKIVGYRNEEELKEVVRDTSYRVRLEDCAQLPDLTTKYLTTELNTQARKAYNEINAEMLTQIDKAPSRKELKKVCREKGIFYKPRESYTSLLVKTVDYINTSSCELMVTKLMRLQQIAGGFLTLDNDEVIELGREKAKVAIEEVLDSTRPVIIFCQYVSEIELLKKELSKLKRNKKKLRVESYRDPKTRDVIYKDFHKGRIDVLILQLASGSVGLNLQKANKVIFYSWSFSSDDYVQGIARIKRRGQKYPMQLIHIIAEDTVDLEILEAVKYKRNLADKLLDE